jgi:hypothetical protein
MKWARAIKHHRRLTKGSSIFLFGYILCDQFRDFSPETEI